MNSAIQKEMVAAEMVETMTKSCLAWPLTISARSFAALASPAAIVARTSAKAASMAARRAAVLSVILALVSVIFR